MYCMKKLRRWYVIFIYINIWILIEEIYVCLVLDNKNVIIFKLLFVIWFMD